MQKKTKASFVLRLSNNECIESNLSKFSIYIFKKLRWTEYQVIYLSFGSNDAIHNVPFYYGSKILIRKNEFTNKKRQWNIMGNIATPQPRVVPDSWTCIMQNMCVYGFEGKCHLCRLNNYILATLLYQCKSLSNSFLH